MTVIGRTGPALLVGLALAASVGVTPAASADVTPQATVRVTWQQQPNGYYCGPAAIRMVISSRTTALPTQAAIASYVGTSPDTGTDRYQVRDGLNHWLGTNAYVVHIVSNPMTNPEIDALWSRIKTSIDTGWSMPVNIVTRAGGLRPPGYAASSNVDHWIVISGFYTSGGQNYVTVHDPASGKPGFNANASYNMNLWTLRNIVTKTYVARPAAPPAFSWNSPGMAGNTNQALSTSNVDRA